MTLSVTDNTGYTLKLPTVEVNPATAKLRLRTSIGKVRLSYGGRTVKAPNNIQAAIGFRANLSAPAEVMTRGQDLPVQALVAGRPEGAGLRDPTEPLDRPGDLHAGELDR